MWGEELRGLKRTFKVELGKEWGQGKDQGRAAVHRPCRFMGWRVVVRVRDGLRPFVVTAWRMVAPSLGAVGFH